MSVIMTPEYTFEINSLTMDDKNIVLDFLSTFFYGDEPLNVAIQLVKEINAAEHLKSYILRWLSNGKFKAI